ncbi:Dimethlysulfonioproprionate lyase DddQ [Ensifer psoraleae]|uniref:dimethylsulfonioproprionate lyase family protein n=1 Tax=Sinorhizobium psoraleae TaxID=520838 RepID=UPI0015685893|nr:dimethylsulfonioproprionate lyase family protein [Sinorhizobium psoraleae]NRP75343.1 Dimethlysulfonioproprionate lyase DddQ [Sinorhizobium psoraleae]
MTTSALTTFLNCFADALDRDARTVSRSHAVRLRRIAEHLPPVNDVPQSRVPIQATCEVELAGYSAQSPLALALAALLPAIHMTRSKSYLANPPSSDFGENYGYGVICGPDNGPPALIKDEEIAFGLMFLGPETHYPLHHHPADELYYTVTGPSFWRASDADWDMRGIDETIHHVPWLPHATLSADRPLVLLYVWEGDLETDAAFIPDVLTAKAALLSEGVDTK